MQEKAVAVNKKKAAEKCRQLLCDLCVGAKYVCRPYRILRRQYIF